ncbi:MAG: 50S ribosomal protein L17 [Anaerolineae bacterium]|nr:50S ribosomal protein L17 [Anaerolineae bacterium]MCA9887188.1 50S ribosomal protein L17 [Anaerolineae bacterium]MCA9891484.1 50S ribosomal protein L17 [Anaerolineae bacterium]MCB9461678.1 50S ribosomal protein L17 [Anaerolineaceae bacterium]
MRHRINGKKLNRSSGQRKALAKTLTHALFTNGRIKTTKAKAEFVRPYAERLITVAKRGLAKAEAQGDEAVAVHARRIAASRMGNDRVMVQKLFDEIAPRFADRNGGYTRMYKLGARKGDNAPMVLLELVGGGEE